MPTWAVILITVICTLIWTELSYIVVYCQVRKDIRASIIRELRNQEVISKLDEKDDVETQRKE